MRKLESLTMYLVIDGYRVHIDPEDNEALLQCLHNARAHAMRQLAAATPTTSTTGPTAKLEKQSKVMGIAIDAIARVRRMDEPSESMMTVNTFLGLIERGDALNSLGSEAVYTVDLSKED